MILGLLLADLAEGEGLFKAKTEQDRNRNKSRITFHERTTPNQTNNLHDHSNKMLKNNIYYVPVYTIE